MGRWWALSGNTGKGFLVMMMLKAVWEPVRSAEITTTSQYPFLSVLLSFRMNRIQRCAQRGTPFPSFTCTRAGPWALYTQKVSVGLPGSHMLRDGLARKDLSPWRPWRSHIVPWFHTCSLPLCENEQTSIPSNYPTLHFFFSPAKLNDKPQTDIPGKWGWGKREGGRSGRGSPWRLCMSRGTITSRVGTLCI